MEAAVPVTPNPFAWFVFFMWLPFALVMFQVAKPKHAMLVVLVGGVMFMPERINVDPPILPPMTKNALCVLWALAGLAWKRPKDLLKAVPFSGPEASFFVMLICCWMMVMTNTNQIVFGVSTFSALGAEDAIGIPFKDVFEFTVPFFIARAMFTNSKDLKQFVWFIVAAEIVYSPFCWTEMRMSPQLHRWIYGFFQHEFVQTIRWGGYRPMVFMSHGLAVGMFMLMGANLSAAIYKLKGRVYMLKGKMLPAYCFLAFLFIKSTGSVIYGLVSVPVILFTSPRFQMRLAVAFALLMISYPILKFTGTFPQDSLVAVAKAVTDDRSARSLSDRFYNDGMLIDKASQKLFFGWGPFGRYRVIDENGQDISVPDGFWIAKAGERGIIMLGCIFFLLLYPVFVASRTLPKLKDKQDQILIAALALTTALFAFDTLPNFMYNPLPVLFSGVLHGCCKGILKAQKKKPVHEASVMAAAPAYMGAPGIQQPAAKTT